MEELCRAYMLARDAGQFPAPILIAGKDGIIETYRLPFPKDEFSERNAVWIDLGL